MTPSAERISAAYQAQLARRRSYGAVLWAIFIALMVAGFRMADARNAGGFWQGLPAIAAALHPAPHADQMAVVRDLVQVWAVSTPEAHLMGVAERLSESRAPGPRAEYGNAATAHSPQTSLAWM